MHVLYVAGSNGSTPALETANGIDALTARFITKLFYRIIAPQ